MSIQPPKSNIAPLPPVIIEEYYEIYKRSQEEFIDTIDTYIQSGQDGINTIFYHYALQNIIKYISAQPNVDMYGVDVIRLKYNIKAID